MEWEVELGLNRRERRRGRVEEPVGWGSVCVRVISADEPMLEIARAEGRGGPVWICWVGGVALRRRFDSGRLSDRRL